MNTRRYPPLSLVLMFVVVPIKLKDKKGGNPDEWPANLRVREMPVVGTFPTTGGGVA